MIVTYTPDDGDAVTWSFKPDRLMTTEAEAIEKVTGLTYAEFGERLINGGSASRRALVWVLRKRHGEANLRFSEVDFPVGALAIDLDDDEKELVRAEIEHNTSLTDEEREEALASLGPANGEPPDPTQSAV